MVGLPGWLVFMFSTGGLPGWWVLFPKPGGAESEELLPLQNPANIRNYWHNVRPLFLCSVGSISVPGNGLGPITAISGYDVTVTPTSFCSLECTSVVDPLSGELGPSRWWEGSGGVLLGKVLKLKALWGSFQHIIYWNFDLLENKSLHFSACYF